MTKAQLEETIQMQKQQMAEMSAQIARLQKEGEEAFKATPLYLSMNTEIKELRDDVKFWKSSANYWQSEKSKLQTQMGTRFDQKLRQIQQDNRELCRKHDVEYWIGIAKDPDRKEIQELTDANDNLSVEKRRLEEKLNLSEEHVKRLQNQLTELLYQFRPDEMPELEELEDHKPTRMGRPPIGSIPDDREARNYRKEGYSLTEIAEIMGWSRSRVYNTVRSVKVDPDVVKKHRAENRKKVRKLDATSV